VLCLGCVSLAVFSQVRSLVALSAGPPFVPGSLRSPRSSRGAPLKGTPATPDLGTTGPPAFSRKQSCSSHQTKKHMPKTATPPTTSNRPVHSIRLGAIEVAIWANPNDAGVIYYNATLSRSYWNGEDIKNADSFGRDDLLVVAKVADLAHTWICERIAEDRADG